MARAPSRTAIWSAAIPTPPPTPQISTVSPAWSLARLVSIRQAVRVARGNAAASDHDIPSGHPGQIRGRHHHQLRRRPRQVLAQDGVVGAERFFAFLAGRAMAAGDAGVDHDPVARLPLARRRPHRLDFAGAVGADHVGERRLGVGQPARHPQVEAVERRAADPDQHLVRSRDRRGGNIEQPEIVQASGPASVRARIVAGSEARTPGSARARPGAG